MTRSMVARGALCIAVLASSITAASGDPLPPEVRDTAPTPDDLRERGVPLPDPLPVVEAARCEPASRSGCPQGTFWIHGSPVVQGARSDPTPDAIVIEGASIRTLSGCEAAPVALRPTEDEVRLSATWRRCGDFVDVKIRGAIDDTGSTLIAKVIFEIGKELVVTATTTTHHAIRIGTYNTKFITSGPPASYQKNPEDAAKKIADRIKASRYDFIALQEVWDEDAKEESDPSVPGFMNRLRKTYPYYVQYLDGDQLNPHEDSGLMFFSKFPFQDLPHTTHQVDWGDCKSGRPNGPNSWEDACDQIAFFEFDSCDDDDCLAEKGAGLVRLRHPQTGTIYNAAFTHLQAPYYDDDEDDMLATYETRAEQLGEIKKLLEDTLDDWRFDSEEIYLFGDLNIDGRVDNLNKGAPSTSNPQTDSFHHNLYEWKRQFASPGAFLTDVLTDAWANDTSPDDLGLSAPRNYEPYFDPAPGRLDFIVRNAKSRLCTQHLTLAHNLRWGDPYVESGLGQPGTAAGAMELSDHLGVTADINLPAPYCSARNPRVSSVAPGTLLPTTGLIQHPGSMQWYRFDEPGTYGFSAEGGNVAFHVYESTDLSMPMANYKDLVRTAYDRLGNPHELKMFLVPKAPFYVRVFVPDYSGWTGSYSLYAKRYDCSSMQESCLIAAGDKRTETFPGGQIIGADDSMWFELHTDATGWDKGSVRVDTGKAQSLAFEVDRLDPAKPAHLSMQVRAGDGTSVLVSDAAYKADVAEPDYGTTPTGYLLATMNEPGALTRFIRVKRSDPAAAATFRVQWRTNLTVLHGSQVGIPNAVPFDFSIADHGDSIGDEEYYFWLVADGDVVVDEKHLGDFSEPSNISLEHLFTSVRYVTSVQVIWVEVDNDYDGGYQSMDDDDLIQATIGTLAPAAACKVAEKKSMVDDEGYGSYHFSFNRCHGLPTV